MEVHSKTPHYQLVRRLAFVDISLTALRIFYLFGLAFVSVASTWLNGPLGLPDPKVLEVVYAGTVGAASVAFAIFCVPYQTEVMLSVAVSNVLTGSQPELHDDGVLKQVLLVVFLISEITWTFKLWAGIVFLLDTTSGAKYTDVVNKTRLWRGIVILFIIMDTLPSLVVCPIKFIIELVFQGCHVYVLTLYLNGLEANSEKTWLNAKSNCPWHTQASGKIVTSIDDGKII